MNIALIGVGELARYFVDEIRLLGHRVTCISRTSKPFITAHDVEQRTTDYSTSSLVAALADCDAAICTLRRGIAGFADIHAAVLDACAASASCKRLIPSAWAGNLEDWPDEPLEWAGELSEVLTMLRAQDEVSWSAVCVGWFAEYVLPDPAQRYLTSSGELWPQDYGNKTFTIYGDGKQLLNVTSARDAARATVKLLEYDRHAWEGYTYVSGEQLSWRELGEFLQRKDPAYRLKQKSLAASVRQYVETTSPEDKTAAMFELWAHSAALHFPMEKVMQHRKRYFSELQFKDLEKLVSDAAAAPGNVI